MNDVKAGDKPAYLASRDRTVDAEQSDSAGSARHGSDEGKWFDAHLHADLYAAGEREAMLKEALSQGVAGVVGVSMHLRSCLDNRALAQACGGRFMPAYGFHPEQPVPPEAELDELFRWIERRYRDGEAFAVGEVGLPYYSRTEAEQAGKLFDEAPYLRLLDRFARLAADIDRPLVLHAVYEDGDKACDIVQRHGVRRVHFHWFKGSPDTRERMIRAGYYISATPDIVYEEEIRELVRAYPLELLMTETDGPWPFEGPFAGRPTRSVMVQEVAAAIAELKRIPVAAAESALRSNAANFYDFRL